ncbi:LURP-one-related/scramblase family protein [Demequina zhanjiangensis]|uniref:LURP-one-related family protein n=1 Tax=Demequina zhanjiangensis TaxID=3051659 RepID=A0ABT8G1D7_9MICO|nr:LURP-one-related family protein [Demequina sp. SYSU T00b26]MDN4472937.1 LURP-one-related family protein [Demequina sp. SYSU T00b26]
MPVPPAPEGYARFLMKSKFGAGRDFRILDPATEADLFLVDGKMGPKPRAEIVDTQGTLLFKVTGKMLGIPKRMDIETAGGEHVAHLHAKPFQFVKDKIEVTLASGEELLLEGNIIEKDYTVRRADGTVAMQITQKWVTVRDKYTVDVLEGVEPGIAFALVWAIDRWVERD